MTKTMKIKKLTAFAITTAIVFSAVPVNLFASDQNGTATALFLRMGEGARGEGLGGAFTAQSGDVECAWWNPAGSVILGGAQFTASYNSFIEDISATYAAAAFPFGANKRNSILINATNVAMGSVDARDATGNSAGSISPTGMEIGAGAALCLTPALSFGLMAKSVQQNLGGDNSSGTAFDAGILIKLSPVLNFGVSEQNLGSSLKTDIKTLNLTVTNQLPTDLRAGFAYYAVKNKLWLTADCERPVDADTFARLGAELAVSDSFTLRGGYNSSTAGGATFGVGILTPISFGGSGNDESWWKEGADRDLAHNVVRVDLAYIATSGFDATYRISLTLKL